MISDWEDVVLIAVVIIGICLAVFIFAQASKFEECTKRGGTPIDTKNGWVCAKIERI